MAAGVLLFLTLVLLGPVSLAAEDMGTLPAPGYSEYEIKSAMLYNFTKFIDWPTSALGVGAAPLVVGVLGDDPFGSWLDTALRNKAVSGHPVVVRRIESPTGMKACHVLFVGASDRQQVAGVLRALGHAPVLTIGNGEQFAKLGGIIGFIWDGHRIRVKINLQAAQQADLGISSQLLRLTAIRPEAPPRPRE
ncbi:MAG: YfiR family protein [Bryobacteraceae bacterium]|jgi:hypothetical protein